ncbi:hypothetical protein ACH5RR_034663 [Cinchona calisaya]|uniref:WAT1-related protein n=1 Tax=Cinchona calisaya TaxID=153742 RepID=A0ABD2YBL0_9GENT
MNYPVFLATALIGLLTGLNDYVFANGVARLPVSTSAIIIASRLAFIAFFAFLLVKQKFTAYSVNTIVLLMVGSGVLALHTSSVRPKGGADFVWGDFANGGVNEHENEASHYLRFGVGNSAGDVFLCHCFLHSRDARKP